MPFTKEQQREYRKVLKAKGICTRCHKRKASEGKAICSICIDEMVVNLTKKRAEWRKDRNRCSSCGKINDTENTMCRRCCDVRNESTAKQRKRFVETGCCRQCGTPLSSDLLESYYCLSCLETKRITAARRRAL